MAKELVGYELIPKTKQTALAQAVHKAFGVNDIEEIHLLTGGLSNALAFKIVVGKIPIY